MFRLVGGDASPPSPPPKSATGSRREQSSQVPRWKILVIFLIATFVTSKKITYINFKGIWKAITVNAKLEKF